MADKELIEFLREYVVENGRQGTLDETKYEAGQLYSLPLKTCAYFLGKRGVARRPVVPGAGEKSPPLAAEKPADEVVTDTPPVAEQPSQEPAEKPQQEQNGNRNGNQHGNQGGKRKRG